MNRPAWLLARGAYYPTLAFSRLMNLLGIWPRWNWVTENVALGARPSAGDMKILHEAGVRSTVNLCEEYAGDAVSLDAIGLRQLCLPTLDYQSPSLDDVRRGVEFIRQEVAAGRKVYVHCKAGQGRSATLALCYLIAELGLPPEQAEAQLRSARPQINRGLSRRPVVRAFACAGE